MAECLIDEEQSRNERLKNYYSDWSHHKLSTFGKTQFINRSSLEEVLGF